MPESRRPHMPGYGIAEAAEGLLPWSYLTERMAAAHNYWVATTRPDGSPHAAPVWGLWHADAFYFSSGPGSRKGRNLAANPRAVVHLESGDEVVILEGVIEIEEDPAVRQALDQAYQAKYNVSMLAAEGLIYHLRAQRALAWRERDFPTSATRWDLE